ncbi:uncharacterized protein LTR77_001222 [Saxophila tyrrhenica]|uniref:Peptidylamidoglycolate lyase n=1 Tax=Saxophila tyrrhenica TaxID=1690608 RepID=A0AAV9PPA2_9PEZI|nr:hypothetical protein LTR77_001222 [Saxophila tyrrhenica]
MQADHWTRTASMRGHVAVRADEAALPGLFESSEQEGVDAKVREHQSSISNIELTDHSIQRLNVSGRSLDDRIIAMSIDEPVGAGFQYRELEIPGAEMHFVGFTGFDYEDHTDLYLVNNKPFIDLTTRKLLDPTDKGANTTIEHIRVNTEAETVTVVGTFSDPHITTPNNIATKGDSSFYFTNDHGPHKLGYRHHLSPFLKDGEIGYCNEGGCRQVESGIGFPNGLSFGADGLLYVPSSFQGDVRVYRPQQDGGLEQIDTIPLSYPLDNLSLDADGDIWVPGLPDIQQTLDGFANPLDVTPPASVFRIKKGQDGYQVDKVLEDGEGEILPAATTVVHDVKTGRLFISGVFSPFISVCEPKK